MPGEEFNQAVTIGGEITDTPHNDAWDNLEDWLNPRFANGDPGDLIVCDSTGDPRPVPASGDLEVDEDGVFSLGRRGVFTDATEETTVSTSFVSLGDEVAGIVVPAEGVLCVLYRALWKQVGSSATGLIHAAIHIDGNPVEQVLPDTAPIATVGVQLGHDATPNWNPLFTSALSDGVNIRSGGLTTGGGSSSDASVGTDPQIFGQSYIGEPAQVEFWQPAIFEVAAGSHTVSVRFRKDTDPDSGTCHVKDRKLRVWAMGFS